MVASSNSGFHRRKKSYWIFISIWVELDGSQLIFYYCLMWQNYLWSLQNIHCTIIAWYFSIFALDWLFRPSWWISIQFNCMFFNVFLYCHIVTFYCNPFTLLLVPHKRIYIQYSMRWVIINELIFIYTHMWDVIGVKWNQLTYKFLLFPSSYQKHIKATVYRECIYLFFFFFSYFVVK